MNQGAVQATAIGWAYITKDGAKLQDTEGLSAGEAETYIEGIKAASFCGVDHVYAYVPGRVLTDDEFADWLKLEAKAGCLLPLDEAARVMGWADRPAIA